MPKKMRATLPQLFRPRTPKEVDPEVLYRIVERVFEGKNHAAIAEELRVSRDLIIRYKKHIDFTKLMNEYLKYHISSRMGEVSDALFKLIKKGNVGAITLALKSIGVVDAKGSLEPTKDTSITVVLPGSAVEVKETIEVQSEDQRERPETDQDFRELPPDSL